MRKNKRKKIPYKIISGLQDIGLKSVNLDDREFLIDWVEMNKFIGLELVLDPIKNWIWRLTPTNEKSDLVKQILCNKLYKKRVDAIDEALLEIINLIKENKKNE